MTARCNYTNEGRGGVKLIESRRLRRNREGSAGVHVYDGGGKSDKGPVGIRRDLCDAPHQTRTGGEQQKSVGTRDRT